MKDMILYKFENGHKFYGMRDLPDYRPVYPSANQDTDRAWRRYEEEVKVFNTKLESCKSSALEIVNPELLPIQKWESGDIGIPHVKNPLKDGDTFPLPSDLKFEEESALGCVWADQIRVLRLIKIEIKPETKHCGGKNCPPFEYACADGCMHPDVVKVESEEKQELSFEAYLKLLGVDHHHACAVTIWDTQLLPLIKYEKK